MHGKIPTTTQGTSVMNQTTEKLNIREFLLKFEGVAMDDVECDAFALLYTWQKQGGRNGF